MRASYLYAHDPACRCCHPHDRPYCPCACHSGVSRGEAVLEEARRPPASEVERAAQVPEIVARLAHVQSLTARIAALDRRLAELDAALAALRGGRRPPDSPPDPPRQPADGRMVLPRKRGA